MVTKLNTLNVARTHTIHTHTQTHTHTHLVLFHVSEGVCVCVCVCVCVYAPVRLSVEESTGRMYIHCLVVHNGLVTLLRILEVHTSHD